MTGSAVGDTTGTGARRLDAHHVRTVDGMLRRRRVAAVWATVMLVAVALSGCSDGSLDAAPTGAGGAPSGSSSADPSTAPSSAPTADASAPAPSPAASVPPRPAAGAVAVLDIPAIRVRGLRVVPYAGRPDDAPGTRIQNRGVAASPRGRGGGVGPGEVGNYIVTGHRTTAGGPLRRLPALPTGARVLVRVGGVVYDYRVTATMTISFRSARDLARQSAAVPGAPGRVPTQAMITLSTCATPEDRAKGNFWTDAFGNPEHRINKIGVLVGVRAA
jgi:sortase A